MKKSGKSIKAGDSLNIVMAEGSDKEYVSKIAVYDVSGNELVVSDSGGHIRMSTGSDYEFFFFDSRSSKYIFRAKVLGRTRFENFPAIRIEMISEIKKIQRREFYRLPYTSEAQVEIKAKRTTAEMMSMRVELHKKGMDTTVDPEYWQIHKGFVKDLSGGGLQLQTRFHLENSDRIRCSFLFEGDRLSFEGEVVRCEPIEDGYFKLGISFLDIDTETRKHLISVIFALERDLISRGLNNGDKSTRGR